MTRPLFEIREAPETFAIADAMRRHHHGEGSSCDWCTEVAVRLVAEVVDPLVAAAEERGRVEGAAAERERIARRIEADPGQTTKRVTMACDDLDGRCDDDCPGHPDTMTYWHGPAHFAAIARGSS
jgi:hypothetical protein